MIEPFEFLVFSDMHCHNHRYGASRTFIPGLSGLYNSRLADSVAVLMEIHSYAVEHSIKHVVFCGDLFHRRTSVPTDVRFVVIDALYKFVDEDIHLHMIPGNHDMGDRKGNYHSLVGLGELSDYIHVYDTVKSLLVPDCAQFVFVPYVDSLSEIKNRLSIAGDLAGTVEVPSILFAHLGMQGAKVGSDYVLVSDSDVSVDDVPRDKFVASFFGHFHEHQELYPNGWFVGATHQHNWGDSGGSRGFLHAKIIDSKVSFEQVETSAPKFIVVKMSDKPDLKENDFVRVITTDKYLDRDKLKERWGLANLEVIVDTDDSDTEFTLDSAQLSPLAVLEQWVDAKLPDTLTKEEVLTVGKGILKKVGYE